MKARLISFVERLGIADSDFSTFSYMLDDACDEEFQRGFDEGYADGFDEAYEEGRETGYDEGYLEAEEHYTSDSNEDCDTEG